jgi:hypothetical protein
VINRLMKALWILSGSAPIFLTFAMAWLLHKPGYQVALVFAVVGLVLGALAFLLLRAFRRKLATLPVQAKKVAQNDKAVSVYAMSYVLPFASIAFDKYNPFLFFATAFLLFAILLVSNYPTINPVLFLAGYHYYEIEADNSVSNLQMLSRRTIRHKQELTTVIRITEYLFLDASEGKRYV